MFSNGFQNVVKRISKCFQKDLKMFSKGFKNVFKRISKSFQNVFKRISKGYQNVFKMFSKWFYYVLNWSFQMLSKAFHFFVLNHVVWNRIYWSFWSCLMLRESFCHAWLNKPKYCWRHMLKTGWANLEFISHSLYFHVVKIWA